MAVREILLLGNPQLLETCDSVTPDEIDSLRPVVQDLHDTTMDFRAKYKPGRAIAAPSSHHHAQWVLAEADGIAIALCQPRDGQLWPKRVFNI